jgi:hypothetical protein
VKLKARMFLWYEYVESSEAERRLGRLNEPPTRLAEEKTAKVGRCRD